MAGRSHWSASIEAVAGEAKLIFDIACRHAEKPMRLSSRYRRAPDEAALLQITSEEARIDEADGFISIEPAIATTSGTTRWKILVSLPGTKY